MKIKVKLPSGSLIEKSFSGSSITIGRSNKCDMIITDESLSRAHCRIELEDDIFFITDLASANGVFIDGVRIPSEKKTQFSAFQEVHIAQMELNVSDEGTAIFKSATLGQHLTPGEGNDLPTKASRQVNVKALNQPFSSSKSSSSPQKKKNFLPAILGGLALIGAGVYFQINKEEQISASHADIVNTPQGVEIKDDFLSLEQYKDKDLSRSCESDFLSSCEMMKIDKASGEGLLKDGHEYFVFMRPSSHEDQNPYKGFEKKDERESLYALKLLLSSDVFEKFQNKEIHQIHLVLKDENYKIYQIFRFHTQYFSKMGPEKNRLMTELINAVDSKSSERFWTEGNFIIQKQLITD